MPEGRFLTIAEQVADHLRGEMVRGRWGETLPGLRQLAAELEVNFKTVNAALRLLEREGLLLPQGAGRRRKIVLPEGSDPPSLRVAILQFEPLKETEGFLVELQHLLVEAGHTAFFIEKSLLELGMNVKRIERLVARTKADAWVVVVGSREVLEFFLGREIPVLALFGRRRGLSVASAGPDKVAAFATVTRRLVAFGHRRIVLLARRARRLPTPGTLEQAFLDELMDRGVTSGAYNLPDWEESRDGFHSCLESLFAVTPPTALIIDEARFFFAAQQFLLNRGLGVPEDVSLVCTDADPAFDWCRPSVAHIRWDTRPVVRRIVRWANNVGRGRDDRRQSFTPAEFVEGGTIGPVGAGAR